MDGFDCFLKIKNTFSNLKMLPMYQVIQQAWYHISVEIIDL